MMIMVDELRRWPHAPLPFRAGACHLTVDGDSDEHLAALHEFAARIGLQRAWFQPLSSPHYDLTKPKRAAALQAGAVFVDAKTQARARVARKRKLSLGSRSSVLAGTILEPAGEPAIGRMAINRIFLDLDGVLADWTSAAIEACGREPAEVFAAWPAGEYDLAVALGISGNAMWRAVHEHGAKFWADLAPYPWMHELVELCMNTAPTTILTSPSRDPRSLAGKLVWLQTYFGHSFTSYLIGPDKAACARPGAVLIDDREHGCEEFVRAGGHAIVFPQTWNRHGLLADPVAFVREQLAAISGTVT